MKPKEFSHAVTRLHFRFNERVNIAAIMTPYSHQNGITFHFRLQLISSVNNKILQKTTISEALGQARKDSFTEGQTHKKKYCTT